MIELIYSAVESGFNIKGNQKTRLLYNNLQQGDDKILLSFKENFDRATEDMETVGQIFPPIKVKISIS